MKLGYYHDDYLQHFVRKSSRRSPLINRGETAPALLKAPPSHCYLRCSLDRKVLMYNTGYYSRQAALGRLLKQFLDISRKHSGPTQILSLGAGFDTTWFRLQVMAMHVPEIVPQHNSK